MEMDLGLPSADQEKLKALQGKILGPGASLTEAVSLDLKDIKGIIDGPTVTVEFK